MFFHLLYGLREYFGAFNVFQYITFRAAMATLTALLVSLLLGPGMIRRLRQFQIGQEIREEGPASHRSKQGTPTMGGLLIITAIVLPTILWADPSNTFVWIAIAATLLFGAIGFADDYLKVSRKRNLGLRVASKFSLQAVTKRRHLGPISSARPGGLIRPRLAPLQKSCSVSPREIRRDFRSRPSA